MATKPVELEIWSDIACPWCWVGLKNLQAALELVDEEVSINWRSFELDPNADTSISDGIDYVAKLAAKYRTSTPEAQAMVDRMTQTGASKGIDFRFDRISPSNTFNAHRLLAWARTLGQQNALKEKLFSTYLHEGLSLNDPTVLIKAATEVGLDAQEAETVVSSDAYADSVLKDRADAQALGVRGVPFFLVDSQVALSGAQPPEVIAQALLDAQAANTTPDDGSESHSCTTDGCNI